MAITANCSAVTCPVFDISMHSQTVSERTNERTNERHTLSSFPSLQLQLQLQLTPTYPIT